MIYVQITMFKDDKKAWFLTKPNNKEILALAHEAWLKW